MLLRHSSKAFFSVGNSEFVVMGLDQGQLASFFFLDCWVTLGCPGSLNAGQGRAGKEKGRAGQGREGKGRGGKEKGPPK